MTICVWFHLDNVSYCKQCASLLQRCQNETDFHKSHVLQLQQCWQIQFFWSLLVSGHSQIQLLYHFEQCHIRSILSLISHQLKCDRRLLYNYLTRGTFCSYMKNTKFRHCPRHPDKNRSEMNQIIR